MEQCELRVISPFAILGLASIIARNSYGGRRKNLFGFVGGCVTYLIAK